MTKRLAKFAFKLLSVHALMTLLTFFIMPGLFGISTNAVYLWCITAFFAAGLWLLVWYDAANAGQKDVQKDKIIARRMEQDENYVPQGEDGKLYQSWMGFVAGFLAELPALLLTVVALVSAGQLQDILTLALAIWNVPYQQVLNTLSGLQPALFLVFPVVYALVAGFGYRSGPAKQRRTETIIERGKNRKARLVREEQAKAKRQRPPRRVVR